MLLPSQLLWLQKWQRCTQNTVKYNQGCHDSHTVYPCICTSMAMEGALTSPCLRSSPCYLLLTKWELLGQCFSLGAVFVQLWFASFFVFWMHESVIYPWDLDQLGAQQSSLWNKLPLSWQLGSRPHPRELLPARKPAASSRRMEGNGDKKSAQSVEEGASTKEERGGSRCRPCAFASSSHACCDELPLHKLLSQGAHRGTSSPVHTLHFGLPRSWSLVSGRCHQARLAKYDSLWQRKTNCCLPIPEGLGYM